MKSLITLLSSMFILATWTTSAHADLIAATDGSWRVTASNPGDSSGWNSDAMFDDSGWELATELYSVNSFHTDYDPGTMGIWSSGGQFSDTETTIWARHVFDLSSLPSLAFLRGGFDDDGEIFINGASVLVDEDDQATNLPGPLVSSLLDITSYLVLGENLVAYRVYDQFDIWGCCNHASYLEITGEFSDVPEPGTAMLFGAGLLALAYRKRATPRQ